MQATGLGLIKPRKTSNGIQTKLKNIYESQGPARKVNLQKYVLLTKMAEEDDRKDHLNKFFDTVDKIKEIGTDMI